VRKKPTAEKSCRGKKKKKKKKNPEKKKKKKKKTQQETMWSPSILLDRHKSTLLSLVFFSSSNINEADPLVIRYSSGGLVQN